MDYTDMFFSYALYLPSSMGFLSTCKLKSILMLCICKPITFYSPYFLLNL